MRPFRFAALALASIAVAGVASAQTPEPPAKVRDACAADFMKFCADAGSERGARMRCMRSHFQEVSPECHAAVVAHRAEMRSKRAGDAAQTPDPTPK